MKTAQEIFDHTVAHLRAQGARAINDNGECEYLSKDGKKCAAGCHILPEHYKPDLEGFIVWTRPVLNALKASGINMDDRKIYNLMDALQVIHDECPLENWEVEFKQLAAEEDLKYTAP